MDSPQSPGTKGNPLKTVQIGTFPSTSIDAVSNFINISGWALASDGVKSVTITITPIANGSPQVVLSKTYTAVYGLGGRDDVIKANSGGYPNGAACGFEYGIDSRSLSNNTEYSISVTSESNDNKSTQTQSIDVYVQNSGSAMPPESNLDIPAKGASIMSGSITVAGWADDMSGVSSIAITMDKTYMGQATIGYDRYDVYEACPGYPNEPYIGYSYLIQSNRFGAGQTHTIYATYTFGNGKTKMDSVTINPPANTPPAPAPAAGGSAQLNVPYFYQNFQTVNGKTETMQSWNTACTVSTNKTNCDTIDSRISSGGCYACAIAMVLKYMNKSTVAKQYDPRTGLTNYLAADPFTVCLSNESFPDSSKFNTLDYQHCVSMSYNVTNSYGCTKTAISASQDEYVKQLNNNNPIILQFPTANGSHFIVLTGYTKDNKGNVTFYVNDPWKASNAGGANIPFSQSIVSGCDILNPTGAEIITSN